MRSLISFSWVMQLAGRWQGRTFSISRPRSFGQSCNMPPTGRKSRHGITLCLTHWQGVRPTGAQRS
jgi:hypothetical protein